MIKIDENIIEKLTYRKKEIFIKIESLIKESGLFPSYKTKTKNLKSFADRSGSYDYIEYGNGRRYTLHYINEYTNNLQIREETEYYPGNNSLSISWNQETEHTSKDLNVFNSFGIDVPKIEKDTIDIIQKSLFSSKVIKKEFYRVDLTYTCCPFSNNLSSELVHIDDLIEKCKSINSINDQEINFLNKLKFYFDDIFNSIEKEIQSSLNDFDSKIKEFDKDNNGIVDVVEGYDDFMKLLKKYQKEILFIDRNYIQQFIKVSNHLKTKRENIQNLFILIKKTSKLTDLDEWIEILKFQCHSLELIFFHSINMITSLIEDDMITFYEIYESFDKLNIFNSNWENEVSQKLTNIEDGLISLIYSIQNMENNIVNQIGNLSYITQKSFNQLNQSVIKELSSIESSIQFNNLLTGIQTYQMYKINKNTKK